MTPFIVAYVVALGLLELVSLVREGLSRQPSTGFLILSLGGLAVLGTWRAEYTWGGGRGGLATGTGLVLAIIVGTGFRPSSIVPDFDADDPPEGVRDPGSQAKIRVLLIAALLAVGIAILRPGWWGTA